VAVRAVGPYDGDDREVRGLAGQVLEPSDTIGATSAVGNRADGGVEPPRPTTGGPTTVTAATTTFLFTDVESSTRLWELDQDGMRRALATHDQILRTAIAAHGGEVVKHLGDGLLAVFDSAPDGVGAAVEAQRQLVGQPWDLGEPLRVRMALHTGDATDARDGDYFGPVLNRCARLIGVAHGGQIIVSEATASVLDVGQSPLPGIGVTPLGQHRLRDLLRPEQVGQVTGDGLPAEFPPLRSLDLWQGHLPLQTTSFVGRDGELAELVELVPEERVVTLVGPGGVGKTRLSLQVAAEVLHRFADGAWFVDLAPITDASLVVREIAAVVGARSEGGAGDLLKGLIDHLADREVLLVLDNCEQVLAEVASAVLSLRERCPRVHVLVTSQQPLRIEGERLWPLAPLPIRTAAQQPGEAVRLFVERAQAVAPGFSLDERTTSVVVELCERLDGIPLAIELAAARSRALQPAELLARLVDRFRLLRGDRQDAIERHQTLRGAVAWSYDLLPPAERQLFDRLAICSGGFDLAAAEWLGGPLDTVDGEALDELEVLDELDVLDLLEHLVGRSLVIAEEHRGATRFRMLQTLRDYGLEQLTASGRRDRVEARHAEHYGEVVRRAHQLLGGPDEKEALARLDADLDNMRAAIAWGIQHQPESALAAVSALWPFWAKRSLVVEAQRWLENLADEIDRFDRLVAVDPDAAADDPAAALDDVARARLYERLGVASFQTGVDVERGIERLLVALEIHARSDDRFRMARVHARIAQNLSSFPQHMDIDRALQHAREAEELLPTDADARSLIDVFSAKAAIALYARRNGEGLDASKRVLRLTSQLASPRPHLYALASMGTHLGYCGRLDEGFGMLEQSWAQAQENGDAFARFLAVWRRGFGSVLALDPDDALLWFEREQAADRAERSPLRLRTMATMVAVARLLRGETRPASELPADESDNGPLFEPLMALCVAEGDDVESIMSLRASEAEVKGNVNDWLQIALLWSRFLSLRGDEEAATALLGDALVAATDDVPCPYYEVPVRCRLALLDVDAEVHLARVRALVDGGDLRGLRVLVEITEAHAAAVQGLEPTEVDRRFEVAVRSARSFSLRWEEGEALARWSRALDEAGRRAEAGHRGGQAHGVFDAVGAPSHWRQLLPVAWR
jgi:predicted ATPase/class 3 adenylate cyclase